MRFFTFLRIKIFCTFFVENVTLLLPVKSKTCTQKHKKKLDLTFNRIKVDMQVVTINSN